MFEYFDFWKVNKHPEAKIQINNCKSGANYYYDKYIVFQQNVTYELMILGKCSFKWTFEPDLKWIYSRKLIINKVFREEI